MRAENVLLKHMMLNYRNHLISHLVSQLLQVISIVHISQIQRKAYNTPVVAREYSEFLNGRLIFSEPEVEGTKEDSYSLFSTENKLVVSAIKKSEDKDGYIIRLYNGQFHEEESDTLVFTQNIKKAYYVDLKKKNMQMVLK